MEYLIYNHFYMHKLGALANEHTKSSGNFEKNLPFISIVVVSIATIALFALADERPTIRIALFCLALVGLCFLWLTTFQNLEFRKASSLKELQYRILADAVSEAVIVHDGVDVIDVNTAFRTLFAYGDMPVGKLDLSVACAPEDIDRLRKMIGLGLNESYSATFMRLDQSKFLGEVRVKSVYFRGKPARIVCIKDITYEKAARESLEKSEKEFKALTLAREQAALAALKLKSDFLANMSHEIRTPLNGIIGTTDLLLEQSMTPVQKQYVETIRHSGESLNVIVNDILDFSKIEAGKLNIEMRPFQLPNVLHTQVALMRKTAEGKGVGLKLEIDPQITGVFLGDSNRLGQILLNLISNAIKFTVQGEVLVRAIFVKADVDSMHVRFSVKDSGIGISPDTVSLLFKPFVQAEASTSRRFGGTGLGLSICKSLVEMMCGIIGVNSEPKVGSEFWFELILDKTEISPDLNRNRLIPDPLVEVPNRRERILLVDDNKVNQMVGVANLHKLGFEVAIANDGLEVLSLLQEQAFDLILMDCQMPVMDGFTATERIREKEKQTHRHVPIIALTANAMKEDEVRCLQSGMDDYLSKPYRRERLSELVEKWLAVGAKSQ